MRSMYRDAGYLNFYTNYSHGTLHLSVNDDVFMRCTNWNNQINMYKPTTIKYNLDVGVGRDDGAIETALNIHNTRDGLAGYIKIYQWRNYYALIEPKNDTGNQRLEFRINDGRYIYMNQSVGVIEFMKPTTNSSDDRLKENEEFIENACETLSKLRPQIYDKKPSIDNEDETTWKKESGLIAQEVYYDAPELRHLVHRASNKVDEDGKDIPLPEIPTSINPQEDPDYSSWGEEAASLNYIGLIAYLVKANNELHDRVKALEILNQPAMES